MIFLFPKDKLKGGKNGDKAVVKIVEWPEEAKNPIGQVIDILGKAGENTTEMHAILAEFGLTLRISQECRDRCRKDSGRDFGGRTMQNVKISAM